MARFSEANYLSRRVKLRDQIADAQRAYQDAALRHELGEAEEAEVTAAKAAVGVLEDRVTGLDMAWQRSQQEAVAEQAQSESAARQAAYSAIGHKLKDRAAAAKRAQAAADELAQAWAALEQAGHDLLSVARPHALTLGTEWFNRLREHFVSDFHSLKPALGRRLTDGGLVLAQGHFSPAGFGQHDRTLVEHAEQQNERLGQIAAELVPDDTREAA